MKNSRFSWTLILAILCTLSSGALANPLVVSDGGSSSSPLSLEAPLGLLVLIGALLGESWVITAMARRDQHPVLDMFIWFVFTFVTYICFIAIPMSLDDMTSLRQALSCKVLIVELAIVLVEAVVLWLVWLRSNPLRALSASFVGNSVSYVVSLISYALWQ